MPNITNILKRSLRLLLFAFLCFSFTYHVNAKTISQSSSFIDSSTRDYFNDVYVREEYKYSILASEYVQNTGSYNSYTYYYLCLTNDKPNVGDTMNLNATCDKLYRYHRNSSVYDIEKLTDNELKVSNAIYYFSDNKQYFLTTYLFILVLFLLVFLFYVIIRDIFRS